MNYWLIKQEPEAYSFDQLKKDKKSEWTGVRNFQARNNLKNMAKGDLCLFYHSVSEKAVVGIAQVSKTAFRDPTADTDTWVCVEVKYFKTFKHSVKLEQIKQSNILQNLKLIKQSRLSVCDITCEEFDEIVRMSENA